MRVILPTIAFLCLLTLNVPAFPQVSVNLEDTKFISDLNDAIGSINNFWDTYNYGASVVSDVNAKNIPSNPSPSLFAGDKLANALNKVITILDGVHTRPSLDEGLATEGINSTDVGERRLALDRLTKRAGVYERRITAAKLIQDRLAAIEKSSKEAYEAADEVGEALQQISQHVPQAYKDTAGLAAVDFITVYEPKLVAIYSSSSTKNKTYIVFLSDSASRLANYKANLLVALQVEYRSLDTRSKSLAEDDAGIATQTPAILSQTIIAQRALDKVIADRQSAHNQRMVIKNKFDEVSKAYFADTGYPAVRSHQLYLDFLQAGRQLDDFDAAHRSFVDQNNKDTAALREKLAQLKSKASQNGSRSSEILKERTTLQSMMYQNTSNQSSLAGQ